jgi:hypothetical protein
VSATRPCVPITSGSPLQIHENRTVTVEFPSGALRPGLDIPGPAADGGRAAVRSPAPDHTWWALACPERAIAVTNPRLCRELAGQLRSPDDVERLRRMATDYDAEADTLDRQQQQQLQQAKSKKP